jgi:hypothetical protein
LDDLLLHAQFIDQDPDAVVPFKGFLDDSCYAIELDTLAPGCSHHGIPSIRAGV